MRRDDPSRGIGGLLRNLIAQLIGVFDFARVSLDKRTYQHYLRSAGYDQGQGTKNLDLLIQLLRRVPPQTILFIIVDGISLFETGESASDAAELIRALRDIARSGEMDAVLKVLMTSATGSRLARHVIDAADYLWLPSDVRDGDGRGSLTEREVVGMTRRRRQIEDEDGDEGGGEDVGSVFLRMVGGNPAP